MVESKLQKAALDQREANKAGSGTAAYVAAASSTTSNPLPSGTPTFNSTASNASALNSSTPKLAGNEQFDPTRRRVSDGASAPIVPDTLNVGIALRVLLITLVGILAFILVTTESGRYLSQLTDLALIVSPILFGTMLGLGFLRPFVNNWPHERQWAVVLAVPALITLAMGLVYTQLFADEVTNPALWIAARAIAAIAVTAALVEYLSLRARALSPSLSEARLHALQARIRPHFLFNSLNTVLGLMRSEPRIAETTLENLSELFRVFMKDTRELIPLQDEVETCRQYLAIEQLRLGGRLSIDWQIEGGPADALVPSLLLQPLVENAVHHGIEPSTEPGVVTINIERVGEQVKISVVNPIPTESAIRPGNQMALSNVRERLMLLYDMEAELETVAHEGYFKLTLNFPYRKERRRRDVRSHLINPDR